MKALLLLVAATGCVYSALGGHSRAEDFIQRAVGDYVIADGQSGDCPHWVRVTEEEGNSLLVVTSGAYGGTFRAIGERYVRTGDDFGTYYDVRAAFTGRDRITSQVRNCSGLVIVRCSEWLDSQSMELDTATGAVAFRFYGAVDAPSCAYSRR